MKKFTDADVARAKLLLAAFDSWRDSHPHAWRMIVSKALEAEKPIGINALIAEVDVPINFAPVIASVLKADHPELATNIRSRATIFDLLF